MEIGNVVKVKDIEALKKDEQLEEHALKIIEENEFTGEITKIEEGINFVGFRNDLGWITQGFKDSEIEVV